MGNQPWHIHFALVHLPSLRPPLYVAPQLREPGFRGGAIDEARHVHDSPAIVVGQHQLAYVRIEQCRLRHVKIRLTPFQRRRFVLFAEPADYSALRMDIGVTRTARSAGTSEPAKVMTSARPTAVANVGGSL